MIALRVITPCVVAALALTACGGPSREDLARDAVDSGYLAKRFGAQSIELSDAATDCIVDILVESDVSDDGLRALATDPGNKLAGLAPDVLAQARDDKADELSTDDVIALTAASTDVLLCFDF